MAEHFGRYRAFAQFLADKGFTVYGFDLRGHGRTAENSRSGGLCPWTEFWQRSLNDIGLWIDFIQSENPGRPLFLLGHSLGSFLARAWAPSSGGRLAGLILSGTGSIPRFWGSLLACAAKIEHEVNGHKEPGTLMHRVVFRFFARSVSPRRTRFDWLTRDDKIINAYRDDPLCGGRLPAGFYHDFLVNVQVLRKSSFLRKIPRELPVYLFSGSNDPVGNFSRGVMEVYREYQKAGVMNISVKIYSGGRHEMLNETNRDEVYRDIFAWMNPRAAIGQAG
jgi:alpha-beta hydrolase superfamily lysophospholipase